jgi:hypothetical protein
MTCRSVEEEEKRLRQPAETGFGIHIAARDALNGQLVAAASCSPQVSTH